mmetsp:Transcript_30535/g.67259  ORF Transcript_30535/g.67259 Transcript_30535/m.67259 type:complete len:278 (-) Transcript_30535:52-885(-)
MCKQVLKCGRRRRKGSGESAQVQYVIRGPYGELSEETVLDILLDECIADLKARVAAAFNLPVKRLRLLAEFTEQLLPDSLRVSQCAKILVPEEGRIVLTVLLADRDLYVEQRIYLPSVLRWGTTLPAHFVDHVTEEQWYQLLSPAKKLAMTLTCLPAFFEYLLKCLCVLPKFLLYLPLRCVFGAKGVERLHDSIDTEFEQYRDGLYRQVAGPIGRYMVQKYHRHFAKQSLQGRLRFLPARGRTSVSKLYIRLRYYTKPCSCGARLVDSEELQSGSMV